MSSKITQNDIALGKRMSRLRKKAGLSQERLAVKTNLTQTHISLIETGNRKASMDALKKIASALGVKVNELIPF
jgi:transcriptional regulator with XRE-family HTH domain